NSAASAHQQVFDAQIVQMTIDRIKVRQQRPLQFDEVLSRCAVKRTLVAGAQPEQLDSRSENRRWVISNFGKGLLSALEVAGRNQEVEIRKASQQVLFVGRPQRALDFRWKPARGFDASSFGVTRFDAKKPDQISGHKRENAMVLRQRNKFAPVERCEIPIRNARAALHGKIRARQSA